MTGHVDPDPAAFAAFRALGPGPVHMLNLLRFRPRAEYGDGTEATGAEAYGRYMDGMTRIMSRVGGRRLWHAAPQGMLIGPEAERWDLAFVIAFPDPSASGAMVGDPDYPGVVRHRTAALEDSRLIPMRPPPEG